MSQSRAKGVEIVPKVFPKDAFDRHKPSIDQDIESFLEDKGKLELLHYMTRNYANIFDTAKNACERLVRHSSVCYLIDFDVLRNYLEMGSLAKLDSYAVEFIFLDSSVPYAIPAGAFHELQQYLAFLTKRRRRIDPVAQFEPITSDYNQLQALRAVASLFSEEDVQELSIEDCGRVLSEEVEGYIVQLHRLISVLTSPRFKGVKVDYLYEHYKGWLSLLATKERFRRHHSKSREKVDRHDALNLAVSSVSLRPSEAWEALERTSPPEYFELVSQTGAVLHLMSQAEDEAIFAEVADLNFNLNLLSMKYQMPVLHPRDAMYLELLGGIKDTVRARATAQVFERQFRDLQRHLGGRHFAEIANEPADLYAKAFGPFILAERNKTKELLGSTIHGLLENEQFSNIEHVRAQSEAIEVARRRIAGGAESESDRLRGKSVLFANLLSQVTKALGAVPGGNYAVCETPPTRERPLLQFQINHEASGDHIGTPLTGEVYGVFDEAGVFHPRYFSVRWNMVTLDEIILDALSQAWEISSDGGASAVWPRLTEIDANSHYWSRGIIAHTSFGDYGMPLETLLAPDRWNVLSYSKLGEIVARDCQKRNIRDGTTLIPDVEQIRVNTSFADILFDVVGGPDARGTFMTLISHADISDQIVRLYCDTNEYVGTQEQLRDVLDRYLHTFPVPATA